MMVGCDEQAAAAIRDALESVDVPAVSAPDARSALELLREARPCAIVCDQRLPGISGLTFLARLSVDRLLGSIPAMVVGLGQRPRAVPPNVKAWLAKPYGIEQACVVVLGILVG
jgi:CheY-like chemotaxis protein